MVTLLNISEEEAMSEQTDKTPEQIEAIEDKVVELVESNELPEAVSEYITLLQQSIGNYQGELYAKNSRIGELEHDNAELRKQLKLH